MRPILVFNHTQHRRLWTWIKVNPTASKDAWFRKQYYTDYFNRQVMDEIVNDCNSCFACATVFPTLEFSNAFQGNCRDLCPLDWKHERKCYEDGTLYSRYMEEVIRWNDKKNKERVDRVFHEMTLHIISKIADKIANIPLKKSLPYELITI